jgi:hypothetical protein
MLRKTVRRKAARGSASDESPSGCRRTPGLRLVAREKRGYATVSQAWKKSEREVTQAGRMRGCVSECVETR